MTTTTRAVDRAMAFEPTLDRKPAPGYPMTEAEYLEWRNDKGIAEWVDGEVLVEMPVTLWHANVAQLLFVILEFFTQRSGLGRVFFAPFETRLGPRQRREPDVYYVAKARLTNLRSAHYEGAPDAIFEVVSEESQTRDLTTKAAEYAAAGVAEYWTVGPSSRQVVARSRQTDGAFQPIANLDGRLHSVSLPGFWLDPNWFWEEPFPSSFDVLRRLNLLPNELPHDLG